MTDPTDGPLRGWYDMHRHLAPDARSDLEARVPELANA
jgi:hypothetical protein